MADQASKDAASKHRIIKHMNGDHAETLSLYLQHYCKLSARAARGASMTDISLSAMIFRTSDGKTHTIPLNPPMASYAEARTRSVDMDREARSALDVSSVRITSYLLPSKPLHVFVFSICTVMWVAFITKYMVVPKTWFYDEVLPYWPGGPESYLWVLKVILFPVLAIHFGEVWWLDRTRLRKYGVERGSLLWWKWAGSNFIEGYGCHQRIDAEVERKQKEAEKAQH
jgi:hypothetical protein